jgi:hypothetical protein
MEAKRPRVWWRRLSLVFAGVLLLLVALLAIRLAPLFLAPNEYGNVPSIEATRTYRDRALMRAAWALPVARRYRRLPYEFQHNQSFCGPTSVSDVLHSMGRASSQERVLRGFPKQTWFGYLLGGLTLDELADLLSRRTGHPVHVLRSLDLARFRAEMRIVNDPGDRVIANFHRGPLFGRGHGHFSPLLAYLPDQDLVLVGDVNPDYRPFLVSTERLWHAVDTIDPDTGRRRGLAVVSVG